MCEFSPKIHETGMKNLVRIKRTEKLVRLAADKVNLKKDFVSKKLPDIFNKTSFDFDLLTLMKKLSKL